MRTAIIAGSGTDTWPGLDGPVTRTADTRYGQVVLTEGKAGGAEVLHLARHEPGHRRLSGHVNHRANLAALLEAGADCLISLTVCGAVDPGVRPGTVVVFDDLYFPGNRLPDGSLCTWHDTPGAAGRGHWIFGQPFSEPVRAALIEAGRAAGTAGLAGGGYGDVGGPPVSSRAEIAAPARRRGAAGRPSRSLTTMAPAAATLAIRNAVTHSANANSSSCGRNPRSLSGRWKRQSNCPRTCRGERPRSAATPLQWR